jgi:uncharacterized radical SAM superfamily Fe-S cluster-containing enzyme
MSLIRTTKSICPVCYRTVDATVYEENGGVWMEKHCAEHGTFTDLCWSDYKLYQKFEARNIAAADSRCTTEPNEDCPFACGLCPQHESYTVLGVIDVTDRCNLSCPMCFAKRRS